MAMADETPVTARKASFLRTMQAVLWSFLGIRKGSDTARDAAELNPIHVVIAGVLAAAVFVGVLIFVVHQVVK
jgi:amino acid transporter